MRKMIVMLLLVLAACTVGNAGWHPWESDATNPNHDHFWSNPLNFAGDVVPGPDDDCATHTYNPNFQYPLIIDAGTDAELNWFGIGTDPINPAQTYVTVNVAGGTLTANQLIVATGNKYGTTLNITDGGYAYSNADMHFAHADGADLHGFINIIDGELECNAGLQVGPWANTNEGTYGQITIYPKGTLSAGPWFNIWDPRPNTPENFIDLRGGKLTMPGDLGDYQGYVAANKIRGYGGLTGVAIATEDIEGVLHTVFTADDFYFDPTPAEGAVVFPDDPLTLSWFLPDPNGTATPLVDVYWNTDAAGDGGDQVLTQQSGATTVDVTGILPNTTYYWKIVATDPNNGGTPFVMEEAVFSLATNAGNQPPVVDAGSDILTFTTDGTVDVTMAGILVDDDGLPGAPTYSWSFSKEPDTIADPTFDPAEADTLDPAVTFTEAGTYTLTLTADDGEFTGSDSMKVYVGTNPCDAARRHPDGYTPFAADINNDCKVTLTDFALLAGDWLNDNALTGPVVLP